jgi:ABC-type bacteriocin/lantibiotic exporter with double-glycine peptidase domain
MKILNKLLYLLSSTERKRAGFLLIMVLFMSLLDMIGVVSIMPFMIVLTNPEAIETNNILKLAFRTAGMFGVQTNQQFLFFLGVLVMVLLVVSLTFKAFTLYLQARFAAICQLNISKRFVENYLHQPYSWILNRHSAELGKTILSEVGSVVSKGLKPMMNLITQGAVVTTLIIMLITINTKLALIIGFTISLAYLLIYRIVRDLLTRIGKERLKANELRFTTVIEAFGAFKELKIGRLEKNFVKKFSKNAKIFSDHEASTQIIATLPRFALEIITFGGMLLVILYFMKQTSTFNEILPLIALYAFAGYRLMPAIQLIYSNITNLHVVGPSLDAMYNDMNSLDPFSIDLSQNALPLNEVITLNHVYYQYPNSSNETLKDINLSIPIHKTVGLVGITGSGKTTTVDIILGLLEPKKGTLEVDGKVINNQNIRAWQRSIGYVPQQIYLTDNSVAENIAFGVDPEDINQEAVERAAKIANLHKFVVNELPLKYQTTLGERGIRLSGGQRQRIGIARAFYHNPKVLILDEATNALDNLTEKVVMNTLENLSENITIIMITHRLSTVKKCDIIYLFEKGKVKEHGTYEKLIQSSDLFLGKTNKLEKD